MSLRFSELKRNLWYLSFSLSKENETAFWNIYIYVCVHLTVILLFRFKFLDSHRWRKLYGNILFATYVKTVKWNRIVIYHSVWYALTLRTDVTCMCPYIWVHLFCSITSPLCVPWLHFFSRKSNSAMHSELHWIGAWQDRLTDQQYVFQILTTWFFTSSSNYCFKIGFYEK